MDWNKEVENLRTGSDMPEFLKLDAGQHIVKFLNDGDERIVHWEDKDIAKVFFRVMKDDKEYTWSVTKGVTANSLYGQIALVARDKGGLTEVSINVVVKGKGKETSYTVLEALPLMKAEEANRKPVQVDKIEG